MEMTSFRKILEDLNLRAHALSYFRYRIISGNIVTTSDLHLADYSKSAVGQSLGQLEDSLSKLVMEKEIETIATEFITEASPDATERRNNQGFYVRPCLIVPKNKEVYLGKENVPFVPERFVVVREAFEAYEWDVKKFVYPEHKNKPYKSK